MFGELPKLFDRNFAVGFFLPVAVFVTVSGLILGKYGFAPNIIAYVATDLLIGTTTIGLISWVGGILLLAINRDLYRIMEGYGKYNPVKLFAWFEMRRYKKTVDELEKLNNEYRYAYETKKDYPAKSRLQRNLLMRKLSEEFPDKEEFLLPTPFGNVLRSFEVYPRVMYGLEAIDGWGRLLTVIPKDYTELIDAAKAQVDFWINIGVVFILIQIEYIGLVYIFDKGTINLWVVLLFIILGTIPLLRATSAAKEWGDLIKSSFDMFAPAMRDNLGFSAPKNRKEEAEQWTKFSQAIIYRLPDRIPELKKQKAENKKNGLTKRAPDAGESAQISGSFLRLIIFLVGRLRRPHPSAGNANR